MPDGARHAAKQVVGVVDGSRILVDRTKKCLSFQENALISTNQLKNGNHIEVDGTVFKILEFQHVKPGKGGAFVRLKLRRAADGAVIDRTFRAGEKFRAVRTEARKMQFLYDGSDAHFYGYRVLRAARRVRVGLSPRRCAGRSRTTPSTSCSSTAGPPTCSCRPGRARGHETEPGLRGDTASGGVHEARHARDRRHDPGPAVRRRRAARRRSRHAPGDYMSRA